MSGISEVKRLLNKVGVTGWREFGGVFTWKKEKVALYVRSYSRLSSLMRKHEETLRRDGWSVLTIWTEKLDKPKSWKVIQAVSICVGLGRVAL